MFRRWSLIYLCLTLFLPAIGFPDEGVFGTAGKILQIGAGSRAEGMGEAFTAVTDDVSALYWNPAGLAHIHQYELTYTHNVWIGDIQNAYFAYAQPFLFGSLALGLNYFNFGEFDRVDIDEDNYPKAADGTFSPFSMIISAGYGTEMMNNTNFGAAFKLVKKNVDTFSTMTVALDMGTQLRDVVTGLDMALMVQNLGLPMEGFPLPLNAKLGCVYSVPLLIDKKLDRFLVSLDGRVPLPFDESYSVNAGLEYEYHKIIAARVGYKLSSINQLGDRAGLTAGFGVSISNFALDYSLAPMGDLGLTHRITLSANFTDKKAAKRYKKKRKKMARKKDGKRAVIKALDQDMDLSGMMMSTLSRVSMRQPVVVNVDAKIDKKDSTRVKKAVFDIQVKLDKVIKRWGLKILNANGKLIKGFSGESKPPKITWKGRNQKGAKVSESIFATYAVEILLEDGKVETVKGKVVLAARETAKTQSERKKLPRIYFKENSADLTPGSIKKLKSAAKIINSRPYVKILISGHTDGDAEKAKGFLLSKRRIDQVVRYLTATYKISLTDIATRAYGKKNPVASNQSEKGRKKNRRVEITIVYKR